MSEISEKLAQLEKTVRARRGALAVSEEQTSWGEHEEYKRYHRDFKALARLKLILQLAPNLRCPDCGVLKTRPRQWVVIASTKSQRLAMCIMCHRRHYANKSGNRKRRLPDDPYKIPGPLVKKEITYYVVSGSKVREARKRAGLSAREFVRELGWSRSFHEKVERDLCVLNKSQLEGIIDVLQNFGVTFV